MFTREHLIIGAGGFVLGGAVATASILAVLSLNRPEPATEAPAPSAAVTAPETPAAPAPSPVAAPAVSAQPAANPAPAQQNQAPKAGKTPALPPTLAAEEADRQAEDAKVLAQRKKLLESQVADSDEIIRLKEQQIRELEAKLNAGH